MKRDVALVLSSGGARGLAHIGAIEELESQGYRITSIKVPYTIKILRLLLFLIS